MNEEDNRPSDDRRATAFHEAAHAVVAYRLDINIGTVSIRTDVDSNEAGNCWVEEWREPDPEDFAVYLFAGLAGHRLVQPHARIEDGAGGDYERAAELLGQDAPPHLVQRAQTMVHQDRAAIEAVAEALLEHGTLHGDSATLIVGCVDEGENWRVLLPQFWRQRGLGPGGSR